MFRKWVQRGKHPNNTRLPYKRHEANKHNWAQTNLGIAGTNAGAKGLEDLASVGRNVGRKHSVRRHNTRTLEPPGYCLCHLASAYESKPRVGSHLQSHCAHACGNETTLKQINESPPTHQQTMYHNRQNQNALSIHKNSNPNTHLLSLFATKLMGMTHK